MKQMSLCGLERIPESGLKGAAVLRVARVCPIFAADGNTLATQVKRGDFDGCPPRVRRFARASFGAYSHVLEDCRDGLCCHRTA